MNQEIQTEKFISKLNRDKFTLTETIKQIECWIQDVQFDLEQDWNEDKELMLIQLQQLIIAKANLETILNTGGQILHSSIKK